MLRVSVIALLLAAGAEAQRARGHPLLRRGTASAEAEAEASRASSSSSSASTLAVPVTRVTAATLIAGPVDEPPIRDGVVVFNDTILWVGAAGAEPSWLPPVDAEVEVETIMPGFWDVHTHFLGDTCSAIESSATNEKFAAGFAPRTYVNFGCALAQLKEALCAGVTSVREVGGMYGQAIAELVAAGVYPAPNFHYAGKAIGMTGGHTDSQYDPIAKTRGDRADVYDGFGALCDGRDDCVRKTREQLRSRADVIKVMTSGGVLSAFDSPLDQEVRCERREEEMRCEMRERRACGRAAGLPSF
jgi:imidazolonepropionase-like amidohydrolase